MLPRYKINKKEQCIALGCGGFDDVPSAGGEADENFCVGPHVLCGLCSTYFGQAYHASSNHKTVCVYHIPAKATSGANYMPRIEHLRGNACLATNDLLEMLRASAQFNAGEEGAKVAWENLVLQRAYRRLPPCDFLEHYQNLSGVLRSPVSSLSCAQRCFHRDPESKCPSGISTAAVSSLHSFILLLLSFASKYR